MTAVVVVAGLGGGGGAIYQACGCATPTFVGGVNYFVSTTGNNSNDCTSIPTACATFKGAYLKASSGQTVEVECGTYSAQELDLDGTKSTTPVVFQPPAAQPASCVLVGSTGLSFGSQNGDGSTANSSAKYVTVKTMTFGGALTNPTTDAGLHFNGSADHIIIDNSVISRFDIAGSSNVTISNSDIGQCKANANDPCLNRLQRGVGNAAPSGILLANDAFHEIGSSDYVNFHTDALAVFATSGLTIRASRFYSNAITNIRIQDRSTVIGGLGSDVSNIRIESTWFNPSWSGDTSQTYGIGASPNADAVDNDSNIPGLVFVENTFNGTTYIQCDAAGGGSGWTANACGTTGSHAKLTGNIMTVTTAGCAAGFTDFAYNIEKAFGAGNPAAACSGTDSLVGSLPTVVNASTGSAFDLHLSGANGAADNFVPTSASCAATDYDGQSRPQNTNCEAGADERNQ